MLIYISLIWFQNKIEMQGERGLSFVERLGRRFRIVRPMVLSSIQDLPQRGATQESTPPSIVDINSHLDATKEFGHLPLREDRRTGISYIDIFTSTRKLKEISAEMREALGINGRNKEVTITFAYDNMGIARKISVQGRSKAASFVIAADPARPESPLQEVRREEGVLTPADALLIAKFGRRMARA